LVSIATHSPLKLDANDHKSTTNNKKEKKASCNNNTKKQDP
jgi:hypothetical protein